MLDDARRVDDANQKYTLLAEKSKLVGTTHSAVKTEQEEILASFVHVYCEKGIVQSARHALSSLEEIDEDFYEVESARKRLVDHILFIIAVVIAIDILIVVTPFGVLHNDYWSITLHRWMCPLPSAL